MAKEKRKLANINDQLRLNRHESNYDPTQTKNYFFDKSNPKLLTTNKMVIQCTDPACAQGDNP